MHHFVMLARLLGFVLLFQLGSLSHAQNEIPNGAWPPWDPSTTACTLEREYSYQFTGVTTGTACGSVAQGLAGTIDRALATAIATSALWQAPTLCGAQYARRNTGGPTHTAFFDTYLETSTNLNFHYDVGYRLRQRFDNCTDWRNYINNRAANQQQIEYMARVDRVGRDDGYSELRECRHCEYVNASPGCTPGRRPFARNFATLFPVMQGGRLPPPGNLVILPPQAIVAYYIPAILLAGSTMAFTPKLYIVQERRRQHLRIPVPQIGRSLPTDAFIITVDASYVYDADAMNKFLKQAGSMPLMTGSWVEVEVEFERSVSDRIDDLINQQPPPNNLGELIQLRDAFLADLNTLRDLIVDLYGTGPISLVPSLESKYVRAFKTYNFVRGDANGDGSVDISDAIHILFFKFSGGDPPWMMDAGDANDDGRVDISDVSYVLNHLFRDGPAPPQPFLEWGPDPTPDSLP